MEKIVVDFAIIGSGPAGLTGAIQAAKSGKSVVLIEKGHFPGGSCLNLGTIPSKSLREAILDLSRYNERSFYGQSCLREVSIKDLNYRLNTVLESERTILFRRFKKNHIRFVRGCARFETPHELVVYDEEAKDYLYITASYFLIGVGSKPRNPLHIPFDDEVILDSTRLLALSAVPKTMIVLGGGVIGAEYASFFSVLGTEVTVLDKRERMLPTLDREIGVHFQADLKENGLLFHPKKVLKRVERKGEKAHVTCEDGSTYEGEILLYAMGREANVQELEIDKAGVLLNAQGYIPVNTNFQTLTPHIYAAGDVIGYPSLASTSMEQGRLAARHALNLPVHPFPTFFPIGIYTIPEISCCGKTEEELQQESIPYEVGRAYYYEIARSQITGGAMMGFFKLLFHQHTRELLGVHIIGRSATELIHIGQVAMSFNAKIDYFVDQVFNYPTFAEGYRIAALNGLNKLS